MCQKTETPCNTRIKLQEAKEEIERLKHSLNIYRDKHQRIADEAIAWSVKRQEPELTLSNIVNIIIDL